MLVMEAMRVHAVHIGAGDPLCRALDMMDLYQVAMLPVVDADGVPIGAVTERDASAAVLRAVVAGTNPSAVVDGVTVRDLMVTPPVTIDERAELASAAGLLLAQPDAQVAVTSEGKLVGTLGRVDICQAALEGTVSSSAGQ